MYDFIANASNLFNQFVRKCSQQTNFRSPSPSSMRFTIHLHTHIERIWHFQCPIEIELKFENRSFLALPSTPISVDASIPYTYLHTVLAFCHSPHSSDDDGCHLTNGVVWSPVIGSRLTTVVSHIAFNLE